MIYLELNPIKYTAVHSVTPTLGTCRDDQNRQDGVGGLPQGSAPEDHPVEAKSSVGVKGNKSPQRSEGEQELLALFTGAVLRSGKV